MRLALLRQREKYLLRDDFLTALGAGAVNGTLCEPGPGSRVVIDTAAQLSLDGAEMAIAGVAPLSNGNPGLWLDAIARLPGRVFVARARATSIAAKGLQVGWDANQSGEVTDGIDQSSGTLIARIDGAAGPVIGSYDAAVNYRYAVVLASTGCLLFAIGGAYAQWTLLWRSLAGATDPVYPAAITNAPLTGTLAADRMRVPIARWLPAPLAWDTFDRDNGAIGSTSGYAGDGSLGGGGGGLAWTGSTWVVLTNRARNVPVAAADNFCTLDPGTSNVVAAVKINAVTTGAGLVLCLDSTSDPQNYLVAYHDGANVVLTKVVAGVPAGLISVAAAFVVDAWLVAIKDGTAVRVYYNGVFISTEQIVSDAGIISNTRHGLYSLHTDCRLDDAVVYARGNEGQYAALNRWSQ